MSATNVQHPATSFDISTHPDSRLTDSPVVQSGFRRAAPSIETIEAANRQPGHIPALDGIRGIAVLLVLFCHATQRPFDSEAINAAFAGGLDKAVLALARLSWSGVDMFFVLSGFLITGILFEAKNKSHFFRNFYARRTLRIFPLYYLCILLFLVIAPLAPAAITKGWGAINTSRVWYPLYLSNFSKAIVEQSGGDTSHVMEVSWTLSIEEQFYLVWPLVVFLFSRRALLKICVGMIFGSMALRIGLLFANKSFWALGFTPCRVDGLAIGAVIALIARGPRGVRSLMKPAKIIGAISCVGLVVMIFVMARLGYRRGIGQSPGYIVCGTLLLGLIFGSILIHAATAERATYTRWFFEHPLLRVFGKYSYAVYLLHMPIVVWVINYLFDPSQKRVRGSLVPSLMLFYVITFSLSLLAAWASWNLFEKHFLKLKKFFPSHTNALAA